MSRRTALAALTVGLTASLALVVPTPGHAATDPCAPGPNVTTYTAAGSPYLVNDLVTGPGQCVVIDAGAGPVTLEFPRTQPLYMAGGSLKTINTSVVNTVTLEPSQGGSVWGGVSSGVGGRGAPAPIAPQIRLTNTTIVGAGIDVYAEQFTASNDTVNGPLCDQVAHPATDALDGFIDVSGTSVTTGAACAEYINPVLLSADRATPVSLDDSTITATDPNIGGVSMSGAMTAHGDEVDGVGNTPAMTINGTFAGGAADGVSNNTGHDDGYPVMSWQGQSSGDLTWPATPAADSANVAPLGLVGSFEVDDGSVTVPSGVQVNASVDIIDGALNAPVGPTYLAGNFSSQGATLNDSEIHGRLWSTAGTTNAGTTVTDTYVSDGLGVGVDGAGAGGNPLTLADSVVTGGVGAGGNASSTATVSGSRLAGANEWGFYDDDSQATLSCDVITGNKGGVELGKGTSSVGLSDLHDNASGPKPDLQSDTDAAHPVNAATNWWGQVGGPTAGQVTGPATTSPSLAASSPCTATVPQQPSAVQDISYDLADHAVTLHWTNPTDPTFTGNVVRVRENSAAATPSEGTPVYSGSGTSASFDDLVPDMVYTFTIFSTEGDSPGTGTATISVVARGPLPVTDLTSDPGYHSVTLHWTPSADPGTTTHICVKPQILLPGYPGCPELYAGTDSEFTTKGTDFGGYLVVTAVDDKGYVSDAKQVTVRGTRMNMSSGAVGPPNPKRGQRFEIGGNVQGIQPGVGGDPTVDPYPIEHFDLYQLKPGGAHELVKSADFPTNGVNFFVHVRRLSAFVVAFPAQDGYIGALTPILTALPQQKIVLHQPKPVVAGHTRTLRGRIRPHPLPIPLAIYAEDPAGGLPTLLGHAEVRRSGKFRFAVRPTKAGQVEYYAGSSKSADFAVSTSNPVSLTVTAR